MILIGDDDRFTLVHHLSKGLRQHIGILRGRRSKAQLFGLDPKECGHAHARLVHLVAAQLAGGVGRIGLYLAFGIKALQPVDHGLAGIGPACVLKEGLPLQSSHIKGGKLGADPIKIKRFCHGDSFTKKAPMRKHRSLLI